MKNELPLTAISVEKLMDRWGLTQAGIFFLYLNHNLQAVGSDGWGQDYYEMTESDVAALIREDGNTFADFDIRYDGAIRLEAQYEALKVQASKIKTIGLDEICSRWEADEMDVYQTLLTFQLNPVDPVGLPLDVQRISDLINVEKILSDSDLLYSRSDIERIEQECGITPNINAQPESTGKKLKHNQIQRLECRKIAEKLWKTDPTITIEDMIRKDELAKFSFQKDGSKMYSLTTLRVWINDLCPNRDPGRRPKKVSK
jgi:hypothetical protein